LKIIGEAKAVGGAHVAAGGRTHIVKTKGIRSPDIVLGFLRSEKIVEPQNYLTQICYENTAFLPFYFLLKQSKITLDQAASIISDEHSTQPARTKLLERIKCDDGLKVPMPFSGNAAGQRKLKNRELLLKKEIPTNPEIQCLKDILAMIRTIQRAELDAGYTKGLLERWFNKHYAHGDLNHEIRRAVCYIDWLLNRPESKI